MTFDHTHSVLPLQGVPETLLYPLKGRYAETKNPGGLLNDPKSVEILDSVAPHIARSGMKRSAVLGACLRTLIFDEQVTAFLSRFPDAVVVNFGCGLDTRCLRVDNGRVRWFDLDLPEVIDIRRRFFNASDRYRMIAGSVMNPQWPEYITENGKFLFIAEGLSYYFSEDQNKCVMRTIMEQFPGAEYLIEIFHPLFLSSAVPKRWRDPLENKAVPYLQWGVKSGRELDGWLERMSFVDEWFVVQRKIQAFPVLLRLCFKVLPVLTRVNKIVHLRFA